MRWALIAVAPAALAAGIAGLVQLLAALVGRGRAAPGARIAPFAQMLLVGIFALTDDYFAGEIVGPSAARASTVSALAIGALVALAARWTRRSVVTPLVCLATLVDVARFFPVRDTVIGAATNVLVPIAVVAAALRLLRLEKRDLACFGVTPWAAGDLAVAPVVLVLAAAVAYETVAQGAPPQDAVAFAYDDLATYPLLGLPAGAFVAGILVYLRRRSPLVTWARS